MAVPTQRESEAFPRDADGKFLLKGMTFEQLEQWVESELGERAFRAEQIWGWLYIRLASSFEEMTNLSKGLRARLAECARIDAIALDAEHVALDGTRKITWRLDDGAIIESVLIPTEKRNTLCISSQVGCAMNCQFCYTARMGLRAHLSTAEIVDQVTQMQRRGGDERRVTNVVFMGMGEPLHNPDRVIPACNILVDRRGLDLSHRKVTVSTSGLVPEIIRLMEETPVRLAVSLNATTDEVRDWLMPINRKYPLSTLMGALRNLDLKRGERITFEYVMLDGVNDSDDDARRIAKLTNRIPCKVNLIPFNPHPGTEFRPSPRARVEAFRAVLLDKGIHATIRETRGDDRMAACGQLGKPGEKQPKRLSPPASIVGDAQGLDSVGPV